MRKIYFLFAAVLFASISFGQSAANYTFSTETTGSLALDRNGAATDMSTGTTTLLAGGNDDASSSVVNIGFDFLFMGVNYTQFSASSNGFMRLGATAVATTASSQTGTATGAIITAFGGDQATVTAAGANSKVHYKLFGTAPNRVLVVEWANMKMNYSSYATATAGNGTYQVLIYETTGIVDLKYGAMSVATTFSTGPVIGFSAGTTAGAIGSITSSTNAVTTNGTAWINNTYTAGAITNLNSAADGSRRVYSFVPASPAAPSSLSFTSLGATSLTLNWTDNATNELGYLIYRSTDGVTYTLNAQVAANATTAAQTGLTPSTLYYYKVTAFTEGATSTVSGSQSTTACAPLATGTYSVGPTGTYLNITAALSALTNGTSGAVVFELQAAYSSAAETFPLTLTNGACSLVGGVTIRPETGATALSISSASTTATIDINGGSNFIIDGRAGGTGTTKELTIANTSTSGTAVRFINEGSTNTLQYVTLTGVNSGTSSGVILFSTTTGANGNDNNTIDNCDIRDGATTPTIGVYSLGTNTSVSTRNSGNTISNCNIFNFYNSTSTASGGYGVNLSTGSTDWTITGNSFYQTASRTSFGSGATVSGINIATLSGNNFTVSNNFLGGTAPSCGGTAYTVSSTGSVIFRGIYISVDLTTASNITGNTVRNISLTPVTTSTSQGAFSILNGWVNVNNNIIGSQSATGSITFSTTSSNAMFSGIFAGSGSANGNITISGNSIGGITVTGTGTPSFRGITFQSSGITSTTQYTVTNNTIGSLTTANSIQNTANAGVFGIVGAAAQTTSLNLISGNTIANLTSTSTGTAAAVTGIASAGSTGGYYTVLNNTIRNLSASSAPTAAGTINVLGISHSAATTAGQNISRNTIYALAAATTAAQSPSVIGIYYSGPTSGTNVVERNLVYDLTNSATGASPAVQGIYAAAGLTRFQNNMVRLGTNVTTNTQVLGINDISGTNSYYFNSVHIGGTASGALNSFAFSSSVTVNTRNFSNNIFSNQRTNSGAGKSYAVQVAGTAANPAGLTLNYNDYYVSGTGTVFGRFNSADVASLAAWNTAVGQDANSISADPLFVSTTGATPDLHVSAGTPIEGVGINIASVTNDFDGDVRTSSTPVDLGADAGNFMSYPVINFTPLANTCVTTSRTLVATITDVDGVPTSGSGLPVLYWKIGSGSYTAVTATSLGSDQYEFSFGSGVAVGNVISYYIAAQDNLGNVGTAPSLGATGFTANPPAASTVPSSLASYTIQNTLSGTYTVGASGDYPTLTAAVTDYNISCLGGPVTFELIDAAYSTSETFPITINSNSTASTTNTLTIKPATGVTASISGSAANYLIRVLGSHVFINGSNNGSTSRDLTITNTSATTPGVLLIGSTGTTPIVNVAARNTIMVNGVNTSTAVLISDVSGAAGYFNNITLQNNSVTKAYIGFYALATVAAGNGSGLNISNNDLSTSGANSIRLAGIYAQGVDGATIQNNLVGNIANTADASNLTGIWLASGTVNTTVGNNTIGPISGTSAGPRGIFVSSGVANAAISISGNTVTGLSTTSTGTATGIALSGATAGVDISGNSVSNIKNTNTTGYGSNGIWLASTSTAANTRVFNNFVWDVASNGYTLSAGVADNGYGMVVSAGAGYAITYNTVLLNTNQTADGLPSALNVTSGVTAAGALDVRNNILATTQSNGTDRYAIYSVAANTVFSSINNNDYWSAGPNLGYISSNRAALADIQTGFGGNTNSKSVAPTFVSAVSPINLHLSNALGDNLCLNGTATPIAGITTDIDGDTRNVTTPDMGADEFNPTLPTFVVNNQSACFGNTVDLTAAGVTAGSAVGQTFTYFTDAACTNAVATPAAVGAGTYYIKATYTSGGCSIDQISSVVVTINALPTVSLTVTETSGSTANDGTICAGDAATLTASGAVSYTWAPGGATTAAITESPATTTSYTVTGTDANGCQNTASTTITVNALPVASIAVAETSGTTNNDGTICAGASATLTASGGTSYSWSNGATTAAITVSPATTTTYTVTVTNANGCSATSNTTITVNALPTPFNVTGGGAYCSGGVGSAVGLSNSEVGVNYQLVLNGTNVGSSVSGTGSAISFGLQTAAGTYTVVATNPTTTCTNNMTGSVTVSINALPTITPTLTQPTTCATNDGGAALTLGGAAGPYTFNWTGLGSVQGQQNQTTLYTGTYSVIVTAANGCQASSSFTLIGPGGCFVCPTVAAVSTTPAAICQGGTATLRATGLADMGISYGIGFVVSATPLANPYTGTIVATVANGSLTNGGSTATATYAFNTPGAQYVYAILRPSPADPACRPFQATQINVVATPDVNAVANQTVCSGAATTAVAFSGTVPGTVYTWTNNTTSIGLAASGTGNIPSFTATNFTNVPVTATVTVTPNNPIPTQVSQTFSYTGAAQTWTVPAGVTSIDVEANGAQGGRVDISGYWSPCCLDGGLGGKVQSKLAVTPGQVLSIYVGGIGFTNGTGGYNGGGTTAPVPGFGLGGAGGGGATDVRIGGTALTNRVVVAGAGGGAGGDGGPTAGGIGGGLIGGAPGTANSTNTILATGGTQTAGGIGGFFSGGGFATSTDGALGAGGGNLSGDGVHAGGGGGYYGGGGGTWAGGAGGSSYTDPTLCSNVTHVQGANTGDGSLKISYNIASSVTCPGPSKTFTITVNPVPTVNTVADVAGCNGSTVTVPFTGFVPGTVYEWTNSNTAIGLAASGNGNLSFTGTNAGTAAISGAIIVTPKFTSNGVTCTGTPIAFTITINPTPTVNAVASETLCSGGATTAVAFSGAVTGTVYNWTNNTPSIGLAASGSGNIASFTAVNAGTAPVTATITVTPSYTSGGSTCTGTATTYTITVSPVAQVNVVSNQVICNGSSTTPVVFSTPTTGGFMSYTWTNSNPTIGLAASGGGNIASFIGVNTGTTPATASITVTPTVSSAPMPELLYYKFDGSGTSVPNYASNPPTGTANATLTGSLTQGSTGLCGGALVGTGTQFDRMSTGWATNFTGPWTLSFWLGNNQFDNNPSYLFGDDAAGAFRCFYGGAAGGNNVLLRGGSSDISVAGVNPASTLITFVYDGTSTKVYTNGQFYQNFPVTFTNAGAGPFFIGGYNGQSQNSFTGKLDEFRLYSRALNATEVAALTTACLNCPGTPRTFTITVNPTPTVNAVSNGVVCNGANTTAVTFGGAVTGTVYNWTNSNTSIGLAASGTGNIASFAAVNTGTTPVTATITVTPSYTNGGTTCTGTPTSYTITVNPTPTVNTVTNQAVCNGSNTTAVTFSGAVTGTVYNWTNNTTSIGLAASGTGDIASFTAVNTGTTPVVATITVTPSANGCSGTPRTFTITVNPTPTVNAVSNQVICNGSNTTAVAFSGAVTGTVYSWTNNTTSIGLAASGTGNIASFAAVNTGTTPVTATITVTPSYTNGGVTCTGTPTSFTITVNPTPTVNVVANQVLCNGSNTTAVTFTGAVAGTVYNWTNNTTSIGLAASGTGNIASFVGVNAGTAPVVATITVTPSFTSGGVTCTGTPRTFTITVNPTPTVNAVSNQVVCNRSTTTAVAFSGAVTGTVYNWTNNTPSIGLAASGTGDIAAFTAVNTTQTPVVATITVTPSYTNGGVTCLGTPRTFTITVNPTPIVSATDLFNQRICISDGPVALNATPVGGTWSGIGVSGFNFIPSATAVGNFILTYSYTNQYGCTTTDTTTAKVSACDERNISLASGGAVLFPNPNGGQFNIRVNSTRFQYLQMRIYNQLGQLISTKQWSGLVYGQILPVNMNHLPAAVYTVRIIYDGGNLYEDRGYKMIIQH
jgi:hypothetical protein